MIKEGFTKIENLIISEAEVLVLERGQISHIPAVKLNVPPLFFSLGHGTDKLRIQL